MKKIKHLQWTEINTEDGRLLITKTESPFGNYTVANADNPQHPDLHNVYLLDVLVGFADSVERGKKKAQEHFEAVVELCFEDSAE